MQRSRAARVALATVLLAVVLPGTATAHSELVTSSPVGGVTLTEPPVEITGDYSEPIDPSRSSMEVRGPDGATIAKGGVPAAGPETRMVITGLPPLAAGTYEVRWTTVTSDDNGVERGTFSFTVAAASPSPPASAAATAGPTAGTSAASATPAAAASPAPGSTATPGGGASSSGGDVLIPLVLLVAVLVGGAFWLLRRRR